MKTILAAPISKHKDYILPQWLDYIFEHFASSVDEILLVDNTLNDRKYHKQIGKLIPEAYSHKTTIVYKPGNARMRIQDRMLDCQVLIQKHCIAQNADLLFVECDIFPPVNLIQEVKKHRKTDSVLGAMYFTGKAEFSYIPFWNSATINGESFMKAYTPNEMFLHVDGSCKELGSSSWGCTLIPLKVLKQVPFRCDENEHATSPADSFFFTDCFIKGIKTDIHTGLLCKHENQSWTEILKSENNMETNENPNKQAHTVNFDECKNYVNALITQKASIENHKKTVDNEEENEWLQARIFELETEIIAKTEFLEMYKSRVLKPA